MSSIFVLVILFFEGGVAMQEFDTEASCEKARQQVTATTVGGRRPAALCVKK